MKRVLVSLSILSILILVLPGSSEAENRGTCRIEGTWYGFNTFGETYIISFNRTGAKTYTAVGQAPLAPAQFFSFITGEFPATQGELFKTGRNKYDTSWMATSWIDPSYDFDTDENFSGAGCGSGWDLMALAVWGPLRMPTCDSWTAVFDLNWIVYQFGTDPFEDGCHMGNPFGQGQGFYQRLPRLP
jgi:hypothetical protein